MLLLPPPLPRESLFMPRATPLRALAQRRDASACTAMRRRHAHARLSRLRERCRQQRYAPSMFRLIRCAQPPPLSSAPASAVAHAIRRRRLPIDAPAPAFDVAKADHRRRYFSVAADVATPRRSDMPPSYVILIVSHDAARCAQTPACRRATKFRFELFHDLPFADSGFADGAAATRFKHAI